MPPSGCVCGGWREQREKEEHPPNEPGLEVGEPLFPLPVLLREPLLQLRIEALEIELVQLSEVGPIGGIHEVEPLHELVSDVVAERLVERTSKLGRYRLR